MHRIRRSPVNSTMGYGEEQETLMRHVKHFLQHRFNPLHVYCRLRDVGLSPRTAGRVSGLYERYVYRVCCPQ
ncbi:hypothetical protein [Nitratidesulfovibrio sp.]|uniref:hypothetical protein n=1 Tax=Nitratidesulfovibrio sp. TaxID=2802297 RepID=UPI003340A8B2